MVPRSVKIFVFIYICISLIGLTAHLRLHPLNKSLYFWWASPTNGISLFIIPILFLRPATVAWGFLLNCFIIGIGTITMAYFSLLQLDQPFSLIWLFTQSTLPAILVLWSKFPIALYILRRMQPLKAPVHKKGCVG